VNTRARASGINAPMTRLRRIGLDELTIRPGTYFNPQTEILLVIDDTLEIDHEIFDAEEFDESDWVVISEDSPLDESKRDELIESFQLAHQVVGGGGEDLDEDLEEDEDEGDEDEELDGVEELGLEDE
jgi:hypothetical protein